MSIRGMQISYQQKVNNLGYMVPLLFQMIDMKDNFLTSQFDSLVLGQQLLQWSMLTNSPAIHHLWMENPPLLSFLWFSTLRKMLFIIHCWIKAQHFHSNQGFSQGLTPFKVVNAYSLRILFRPTYQVKPQP
jgi:hypothetical protein